MTDPRITVSDEVAEALAAGRPVVALESTIISHGLPRPDNREAAAGFEALLRDRGVAPATIAVLDGVLRVGLDDAGLDRIADEPMAKASIRDLPVLTARGGSAATTVAATMRLAALAGIRVFATGGLGGVHRGAATTFDESADLGALAAHPVAVVCAGVKSVLDIGATLERLETLSVPVVGYRTDAFPAFWLPDSGHPLDWRVDSPEEVAAVLAAQDALAGPGATPGLVLANPVPDELAWDRSEHDRLLAQAFAAADAAKVRGKAVTPFLLAFLVDASGGRSLAVNLALARNNVAVAADVATAYAAA
ncbi:MAG: pseudouridine-5'-phosphate glycosidase [Amnibacterium sp.]